MLAAVRRRLLPLPLAAFSTATSSTAAAAADPTVSYLISSCGLSPAAAARAATAVRVASPDAAAQADAVLALLRRHGFSAADVSAAVVKCPSVLAANPARTLRPKLEFLASVGVVAPLLPRLVLVSPIILHRSVHRHLAPLFASLREVLGSDARVVAALRRMPFILRCHTSLFPALPLLRDVHGLTPDEVSNLAALQPGIVLQSTERINEIVQACRNAGVQPGSSMFIYVFDALSSLKATTVESKIALYRRLGFDMDSVAEMIRRYPGVLTISEKKIEETVAFLLGKAGMTREDIVTYPTLLVRNLQGHSMRCAVIAALRRGGKRQGDYRLAVGLVTPQERFLNVYVRPHAEELPDVLRAMNGEIPFEGFGGSEEGERKKLRKKTRA
ncbi:hypothetical protein ACP4OV_001228 [Aristida adscensionis]